MKNVRVSDGQGGTRSIDEVGTPLPVRVLAAMLADTWCYHWYEDWEYMKGAVPCYVYHVRQRDTPRKWRDVRHFIRNHEFMLMEIQRTPPQEDDIYFVVAVRALLTWIEQEMVDLGLVTGDA